MPGLFGSLYSAGTGLSVNQLSIETTSHNINNMKTEGYTRQKVERSAKSAYSYPGFNSSLGAGQLGTGVEATSIIRMRNALYDYQYRTEATDYGTTRIQYDYYNSMENIFNEPSATQISSSLDDFFDEWNELTKDPNSVGAKSSAVSKIQYLVDGINRAYNKLENLKENLSKQQNDIISDINNSFDRLADLDKDINLIQATGKNPNDLLDERDQILDELSEKLDIYKEGDVTPTAKENIQTLIDGFRKSTDGSISLQYDKLMLTYDATGINIKATKNGTDVKTLNLGKDLTGEELGKDIGGQLGATIEMNEEIKNYENDLTNFAKGLSKAVNKIYKEVTTNTDLLNTSGLSDGEIITLRDDIDKDPAILNMTSDMALALYGLKNKKVEFTGVRGVTDKMTITNCYNNIMQNLGQASAAAIKAEKNQNKLLQTIESSRSDESSVSLDEEMVDMIQFQHGYSASAKVISTLDELLDVVINGLKR